MQNFSRREFLSLSLALSGTAFVPSLFASKKTTIWCPPAIPSVVVAAALEDKNSDFDMQIWKNPDQLRAGVGSGEFEVMITPINVGVSLNNQGQNIRSIANMLSGPNYLLAKDGVRIDSLDDLVGKKLILPFKNDMPDILLKAPCKAIGIDANKLDITYAPSPVEAMGLFLTKDYDISSMPEPMISVAILRAKQSGKTLKRVDVLSRAWSEIFGLKSVPRTGLCVRANFYEKNKEMVESLVSQMMESSKWVESNPQSAAKIGSSYLPAPLPALESAIINSDLSVSRSKDIKDDVMKFFEVIFEFNPKLLGGKMPDESYFL